MGVYEQIYNPAGNIWISAAVAAIPIIFFVIALTLFKLKGYYAGLGALLLAVIIAVFFYKIPLIKMIMAAVYGILSGLWPVAAIVIFAIFLYKLTVKIGKFEIIKNSIASITDDRRLQVLLVAYCFGAFLEGAAGFGAPVAITAVILVGLGFNPAKAAVLCLVANIAAGSYGAMGIPVTVPSTLTGLDALEVATRTAFIIPVISFLVPFFLMFLVDGLKGVKETIVPTAICAGAYSLTQLLVLTTLGAVLVDILAAIVGLLALAIYLRPKFEIPWSEIGKAWLPFGLLTVLVIIMSRFDAAWKIPIAALHNQIVKVPPVAPEPTPYAAIFKFDVLTSTATAILIAGLLSVWIYRVTSSTAVSAARETVRELIAPVLTICSVLAFAYVSNYSGMSASLGLAFASTGHIFPLFSPMLGWLGVFLTGSVVNSGSLFAPLQVVTASQIGIDTASMVAANVMGGDMAKMVSPQSVAVAVAAVGLAGSEGKILKEVMKISAVFLIAVCVVNFIIYGV